MPLPSDNAQHLQLVAAADTTFPGSVPVAVLEPQGKSQLAHLLGPDDAAPQAWEAWLPWLMGRIKGLVRPTDLVTHLGCAGRGCHKCDQGRVPIGPLDAAPEEHRLELGVRLACLSIYHCPPDKKPWLERAIDQLCRRWDIVARQNVPNF